MKKLSIKQKIYLLKKSKKAIKKRQAHKIKVAKRKRDAAATFKPFKVTMWDGSFERIALCMTPPTSPPENINFDQDVDETLDFLQFIRDKLGRRQGSGHATPVWLRERKNRLPRIYGFHDYAKIKSISIGAALVVASCYDRAKRMTGQVPPAINYTDWPDEVFQVFYEVGFFDFIGHSKESDLGEIHRARCDGDFRVMSAISGQNANGLEACSDEILNLLKFLSPCESTAMEILPEINTAVSEAMINVARHAYPAEFARTSPYDTIGQWWMTARADKSLGQLKIVVYDQGATIPGTLPHRSWFQATVENVIRSVSPSFVYDESNRAFDHEYINYSMKEGKTQTGVRERGLGLPQMQALIDLCEGGALTVVSRSGLYRYDKLGGITKRALQTELEGTLVEWNLLLPNRKQDG